MLTVVPRFYKRIALKNLIFQTLSIAMHMFCFSGLQGRCYVDDLDCVLIGKHFLWITTCLFFFLRLATCDLPFLHDYFKYINCCDFIFRSELPERTKGRNHNLYWVECYNSYHNDMYMLLLLSSWDTAPNICN